MLKNILILSIFILSGCTTLEPPLSCPPLDGDGKSKETAVNSSIYDPYHWIPDNYPGSNILLQALYYHPNEGKYDLFEVKLSDGTEIDVWFSLPNLKCLKILRESTK